MLFFNTFICISYKEHHACSSRETKREMAIVSSKIHVRLHEITAMPVHFSMCFQQELAVRIFLDVHKLKTWCGGVLPKSQLSPVTVDWMVSAQDRLLFDLDVPWPNDPYELPLPLSPQSVRLFEFLPLSVIWNCASRTIQTWTVSQLQVGGVWLLCGPGQISRRSEPGHCRCATLA